MCSIRNRSCPLQLYVPQVYSLGLMGMWRGACKLCPQLLSHRLMVLLGKGKLSYYDKTLPDAVKGLGLEFGLPTSFPILLTLYCGPCGTEWSSGFICSAKCSFTCVRKDGSTESNRVEQSCCKFNFLPNNFSWFTLFAWEFLLMVGPYAASNSTTDQQNKIFCFKWTPIEWNNPNWILLTWRKENWNIFEKSNTCGMKAWKWSSVISLL